MSKNWEEKTLGEVCQNTSNIKWNDSLSNEYKYIDLSSVSRNNLNITDSVDITKETAPSRAKKIIQINDIIFATTRPTLKRLTIIPKEYDNQICSTGYVVLRPKQEIIESKYIYYFLRTDDFINLMESLQKGASYPAVSDKDVKNVLIKFPSLISTQKQIVEILDTAFEALEKVKTNLEKNLKNTKELFDSKLNEIFSQKGEGWEEKTLGEFCIVERGSSPRPIKRYVTENGVNWIKIGDTKGIEKYIYNTKEQITIEGAKKSRFVDIDDFILSNSMSFGRPYIMKTKGYIHDGWFVLRLPENIDIEFFWYLLVSPYVNQQFKDLASGAIVKNISGDLVKKAILNIPNLIEQKLIVRQLDNLSNKTKQLVQKYQQKLDNIEELKKSLLQKAFSGELTK